MTWGAWRLCRSPEVWLARPSDLDSPPPGVERVGADAACLRLRDWFWYAAYQRSLPWDLIKELEDRHWIGIRKKKLRKRVKRALRDGRLIAFAAPAPAGSGAARRSA